MKNMLRTLLSLLIVLSVIGTGTNQAFAQTVKHSSRADLVEITICSAEQTPKTILIDQNGNQVPEPAQCNCPTCPNCLIGSAFKLPLPIGEIGHDRKVILTVIPQSFDITGAASTAPATARAPPAQGLNS